MTDAATTDAFLPAGDCPATQVPCGAVCVSTDTDRDHCGSCDNQCDPGEICDGNGDCALNCQLGFIACNDTCIDPLTNRLYCGATEACIDGIVCSAGEICDGTGHCALSCQPELLDCNDLCIDPETDRTYCGAAYPCEDFDGVSCEPGYICESGSCVLSCQDGLVDCDGTCINPLTDRDHCGAGAACLDPGDQCEANEVCALGDCMVPGVATVSVGYAHICALMIDGNKVRCWGSGHDGGLGYGNETDIGDNEFPSSVGFVDVGGNVVQLAAGGGYNCVLLDSNEVRCWGQGDYGRLGLGNEDDIGDDELPAAVSVVSVGATPTQLDTGAAHTCVRTTTSRARCWGYGFRGRLGYGNENHIGDNELPSAVGNISVGTTVVQVATGDAHTCARFAAGMVRCWGQGVYGALGYPNTESIGDDEAPLTAGDVDVGGVVASIVTGNHHTCALLNNGKVRCWGSPSNGPLGYATSPIGATPALSGDIDVGGTVVQLTAGQGHTCALLDTGAIRCWGDNEWGSLGYGNTEDIGDDETPASAGDVDIGGTAVQISAGGTSTCAIRSDASLFCWGGAGSKLGYGTTDVIGDDETPVEAGPVPVF